MYTALRAVIYTSILIEFFAFCIGPEHFPVSDGLIRDVHSRVTRFFIYKPGNIIYSLKSATALIR